MQSYGHRGYWNTEAKPAGVVRVLCMGDSLTFGQGVAPYEAYPAVLEELLNRFSWEHAVEVVNEGVSGYSLHDCFLNFRQRGADLGADLAILTLCDNDAEFHATAGRDYTAYAQANWDPRGPVYPQFVKALGRFAAQAEALGLPLVVCFVSITGEDPWQRRLAGQMERAAQAAGLSFCDLSLEFTGPQSANATAAAYVSDVDRHPSASAHRTMAMRLARHVMTSELLPAGEGRAPTEAEVVARCRDAAREFAALGRPAESACRWLRTALSAKRQSRARVRLPEAALLPEAEHAELLRGLEGEQATLGLLRHLEGCAALLDHEAFRTLNGMQRAVERINKHCALLEARAWESAPLAEALEFLISGGINRGPGGRGPGDLAEAAGALETLVRRGLGRLDACAAVLDAPGVISHALRGVAPVGLLRRGLWELDALARACAEAVRRLEALLARGREALPEEAMPAAGLLLTHVDGVLDRLETLADGAGLRHLPEPSGPGCREPYTVLSLRLKVPERARGAMVRLVLHAARPFLPPVFDLHHLRPEAVEHSYAFHFPLTVNGSVSVELAGGPEGLALADVLTGIEVNPGRTGSLSIAPEGLEPETPLRAWLHLALLRP